MRPQPAWATAAAVLSGIGAANAPAGAEQAQAWGNFVVTGVGGFVMNGLQFLEHTYGVRDASRALQECLENEGRAGEAEILRRRNEVLERELEQLRQRAAGAQRQP